MLSSFLVQTLNGLASASLLFLVALGLTLIFGVTRIVNFAHGSLTMLGAYIAVTLHARLGGGALGFWGGALLAGLTVAAIGVLIETLILRRIYAAPELLQLTATFGLVLVIKDITLAVWGAEDILGPRPPGFTGAVDILGRRVPTYDLLLIALGPLFLVAVTLLLKRTRWGIRLRAATEDRDMTAALGVDQARLFTGVFALGAFLAGLGGALALPREPANLAIDLTIIADVFVVTVVGGLGSITGAYIAAVLVAVTKAWCIGLGEVSILGATVSFTRLTLVVEFIVMAVVLIWRPWGLLGTKPAPHRTASSQLPSVPKPRPKEPALAAAIVGLLALLPLVADRFAVVLVTDMLVFALFAASLGFLMGPAGITSFGHAAYLGGGAYAAALATKAGAPFPVAVALGFTFAGMLAALLGAFAVRLSGVSLAMLTLAFAQIVWAIVFQWDGVTGGSNGIVGVWPPPWLASKSAYYLIVLALVAAMLLALRHLVHTPFGYMLRAVRDAPARAEALGLGARSLQLAAFVVAGALAGLAGALYVLSKGSLSPDVAAIPRSVDALVMVLLGGLNTFAGPIVGAAVLTWLADSVSRAVVYWQAMLGATIILICLAFPDGIVGTLRRRLGLLASARQARAVRARP
jgi:branched-chain amino acid transport system permease protein